MLLLWALFITCAAAHRVTESTEDIPQEPFNTTTLYPVANRTEPDDPEKTDTSWKIETTFAESNLVKEDDNNTGSIEVVEKPGDASKEFKASPHLGNFFDGESVVVVPTRPSMETFNPVIKKPPSAFVSSSKNKYPKDILKNYNGFPYKMDKPILTRAKDSWRPTSGGGGHSASSASSAGGAMEPAPTAALPSRVPAGGLYQLGDPFRDKPGMGGGDDDFGLEFTSGAGGKDNAVRKRVNPWKKLLHLVTAFIPVGLIISALTPSVITIQNAGGDHQQAPYRGQAVRRAGAVGAGGAAAPVAPASERCRRRLLCELHADRNYSPSSSPRGRSAPCQRIRCEEPEVLARALRRLLTLQPTTAPSASAADDHRHLNT